MSQFDLGKFAVTNGGNYSSDTTYEKLTIVRYNGASWVSMKTTRGNIPHSNSEYWRLVLKDGIRGPQADQTLATLTLNASSWTGDAAPYQYDLSTQLSTGLGDDYNANLKVEVALDHDNATDAQVEAYYNCGMVSNNTQKVFVSYSKPSVNIPVILTIQSGGGG